MKIYYLLGLILSLLISCSEKLNHAFYEGYIFSNDRMPVKGLRVSTEWDKRNAAYTNKDGFFKLRKDKNLVSNLFIYKDSILIDSIQVIRNSGGEKVVFYFVEGRKDTLFINK